MGRASVRGNRLIGGSGGPFLQKEQLSATEEIPQNIAEASLWGGSVFAGVGRAVYSMHKMHVVGTTGSSGAEPDIK